MDEGRESSWPNLALRAEMRPYIEENRISTPFGLKSCHRRHLRGIVLVINAPFRMIGRIRSALKPRVRVGAR